MSWPPVYSGNYRPSDNEPYWFRREETLSKEERQSLVFGKLKSQIEYAWEKSPFYREKWQAAGFSPDRLRGLGDLRRIPFLTKDEVRKEQEEYPPLGRYLCADPGSLLRIHGTSGTTENPPSSRLTRETGNVSHTPMPGSCGDSECVPRTRSSSDPSLVST